MTLLLPSAFGCESALTQVRPQRPKLPSFAAYQAQSQPHIPQSTILTSCRALQTLLGNSIPSPRLPFRSPSRQLSNPFEAEYLRVTRPAAKRQPPRGANKRRRDEFENGDEQSKENVQPRGQHDHVSSKPIDSCSTPKRQRRIPMCMPLGLSAADFRALDEPVTQNLQVSLPVQRSPDPYSDDDSGYGPSPVSEDKEWTIDDDRVLVETVLEKLRLSKREWNDCAKKLGKDRDSLGRRWNSLVGEGNVGLRRGGRVRRQDLDIRSW